MYNPNWVKACVTHVAADKHTDAGLIQCSHVVQPPLFYSTTKISYMSENARVQRPCGFGNDPMRVSIHKAVQCNVLMQRDSHTVPETMSQSGPSRPAAPLILPGSERQAVWNVLEACVVGFNSTWNDGRL